MVITTQIGKAMQQTSNLCKVAGCVKSRWARGFCNTHYARYRKHGDPGIGGAIASKTQRSKHPLYGSWAGMIGRCHNPNHDSYPQYGARGIAVCPEWRASFHDFLNDMGERPEGMTLDRIESTGPYSKENCRWATPQEQRTNQSDDGKKRQREGARAGALRRWGNQ